MRQVLRLRVGALADGSAEALGLFPF